MSNAFYSLHLYFTGAELQFEGDTLDKFETFMLHLMPQVNELRVVFVGSELNTENLPLDIISRIRPCRKCRKDCRAVKFEFHCKQIYNEYCSSSAYSKPDIICFFNPTFYHSKGSHYDKWSFTIRAAVEQQCPIVVTSYTEYESPLDFEVFMEDSKDVEYNFEVLQTPARNPYGSRKPERNFVSEEVASMVFKNFWWFIVK